MPIQLIYPPPNLEGIRVELIKYYNFITVQSPNQALVDVFQLTSKKSGMHFLTVYYYATGDIGPYAPYFYMFDQYYPPGSTNYPLNPWSAYGILAGSLGALWSNSPLANEITCKIVEGSVNPNFVSAYLLPIAPNSHTGYGYECFYKYNPQYILSASIGFFYIPVGQSAWVGFAPYTNTQSNSTLVFRALTAWEVY
ncbi:MAG: hypothetical protein QXE51_05540 [Nitrososphaeria archaeon]